MKLAELSRAHPELVEAVEKGDVNQVAKIMHTNNMKRIREIKEKERRFLELSKDPMNPEYQKMLEERINQ